MDTSSDDEDLGEEGEFDFDDEIDQEELMKRLDPEMREKFEKGEMTLDDLKAIGLADGDLLFGEGGEEELDEGEYGDEQDGEKDKAD